MAFLLNCFFQYSTKSEERCACSLIFRRSCRSFAGNATKHDGVASTGTIHTGRAVETTGHFTGGKQTVDRLAIGVHRMRVSIDQNTAHEIVCTHTEVVSIKP